MAALAGVLAWACALLVGCATTPSASGEGDKIAPPKDRPKLASLRREGIAPVQAGPLGAEAIAQVHVFQFVFPLNTDLDNAWAITRNGRWDPQAADLWHRNAIRVAVLDESRIEAFNEAIAATITDKQWLFAGSRDFTGLPTAPKFNKRVRFPLQHLNKPAEEIAARQGRFQFLMRFRPGATPSTNQADIVPHLHQVRASLVPRPRHVELLDGRIFASQMLRTQLAADELLVVGLRLPPPPPKPKPPVKEDSDKSEGSKENADNKRKTDKDDNGENKTASPDQPTKDGQADDATNGQTPGSTRTGNNPSDADNGADTEPETKPVDKEIKVPDDVFDRKELPTGPTYNRIGSHLLAAKRIGKPIMMMLVIRARSSQAIIDAYKKKQKAEAEANREQEHCEPQDK